MAKKVIVVISGRRCSGKDTFANMVAAAVLNRRPFHEEFFVRDGCLLKRNNSVSSSMVDLRHVVGFEEDIKKYRIRIVSFATKLKQFCMEVLGLTQQQCYGSNEDKAQFTNLLWQGMPIAVRRRASWDARQVAWWNPLGWPWRLIPRRGLMRAREVLQYFATEVIRKLSHNSWANAAYKFAVACDEPIIFIPDCRFPNEVMAGHDWDGDDVKVFVVRLLRRKFKKDSHVSEKLLDKAPISWFNMILPEDVTLTSMELFAETVADWIDESLEKVCISRED